MKLIISAGGTGGHIYPAIAIINKLKEIDKNIDILYIGTTDRMEKDIIPNLNIPFIGIEMKGLNRKNVFKNINVLHSLHLAVLKVTKIIDDFKPDVVIGVGGYITFPVIYAAYKLKIKTFIHEQNSIPGLSNKILSKYADKIGISLPGSLKYFKKAKTVLTGNPRSEEVYNATNVSLTSYNLDKDKKTVLIVMGSLGSLTINNLFKDILLKFNKKNYQVLFVSGKNYYDEFKKIKLPNNVVVVPFIKNMVNVLKSVDLIVSRSGASTIAEITAAKLPSILIPSPYVTHNHQYMNALELKNKDACILLEEKDLNAKTLIDKIDLILNDKTLYMQLKDNTKKLAITNSASKIVEIIIDLANGEKHE
ncbi:MAG: undecaprenyldiphospho-muramoylpentapeptide beta-N-acetylglucosaminyltransferase [Bacilli bacterium]